MAGVSKKSDVVVSGAVVRIGLENLASAAQDFREVRVILEESLGEPLKVRSSTNRKRRRRSL